MSSASLVWLGRSHSLLSWLALFALATSVFLIARTTKSPPSGAPFLGAAPQVTSKTIRNRSFHNLLAITALLHLAVFITGVFLHPPFQNKLRQKLFLMSATLGWLFERKEHIAFAAISLVLCGFFANIAAANVGKVQPSPPPTPRNETTEPGTDFVRQRLLRATHMALFGALLLTLAALLVSLFTARYVQF